MKRLGLAYTPFGAPVPLFKRLGGPFFPKNSPFQRRVEKVGLEAVLLPFGQDGLLAVGNDGTLWSALNNWKDQLTWVELPSLPAGRLIQSITLTSNWSSANCYALATDGTIWGNQRGQQRAHRADTLHEPLAHELSTRCRSAVTVHGDQ